ncbi:MAG: hypothetical protein HY841_12705 [Bacteroidetes bacterium]|nr:hypothetical protein [Bacteroidota bacterium]
MSFKPIQIFGFIMSFAYVFFGLLFLMTTFAVGAIEDPQYRKIFGGALMAYGLFRVAFFLRKLRDKS